MTSQGDGYLGWRKFGDVLPDLAMRVRTLSLQWYQQMLGTEKFGIYKLLERLA